ncbi:hypothetical protein V8E54_014621 [Elaphomyces granulatus]
MMRFALILFAFAMGTSANNGPTKQDIKFTDYEELGHPDTWPVVKYDGPLYKMTPEMLRERTMNESWERPKDMPVINVEPGTHLVLGATGNSSLEKRHGDPIIAPYRDWGCPGRDPIIIVADFGCGTGCISFSYNTECCIIAFSGMVSQLFHGNPYPTMDVWDNGFCNGSPLQHLGVVDTESCTDVILGFQSFIGYYNC